jgi:hypothetical protein
MTESISFFHAAAHFAYIPLKGLSYPFNSLAHGREDMYRVDDVVNGEFQFYRQVNLSPDAEVILEYDLEANDAFLEGPGHGFSASTNLKLLENGLDVSFHCALPLSKGHQHKVGMVERSSNPGGSNLAFSDRDSYKIQGGETAAYTTY